MDIENLSLMTCYECKNYFFVHELPMDMNDPKYCPYRGTKFDQTIDISENEW